MRQPKLHRCLNRLYHLAPSFAHWPGRLHCPRLDRYRWWCRCYWLCLCLGCCFICRFFRRPPQDHLVCCPLCLIRRFLRWSPQLGFLQGIFCHWRRLGRRCLCHSLRCRFCPQRPRSARCSRRRRWPLYRSLLSPELASWLCAVLSLSLSAPCAFLKYRLVNEFDVISFLLLSRSAVCGFNNTAVDESWCDRFLLLSLSLCAIRLLTKPLLIPLLIPC